ncbi:MAG: hypothetical protein IJX87_00920 [Clostridia bacterium]|nr:hypothetical protein [Clostridia bacterium]
MKKLRLALLAGCCLALAGGFAACGGGGQQSSESGGEQVENTFLVDLPEEGDYEVFSEISLETAAGVWNETQIVDPTSITVTYGENKETVTLKDDMLTLDKVGVYTATFTFARPDGTTETHTRTFTVADTTAPTIVGKFKTKYVQNTAVSLDDSILVVDALDDTPTTDVKVYYGDKTDGNLLAVENGVFTPTQIGVHTAVITATDAYQNVNVKEYAFRVADVHELEYFNGDELISNVATSLGGALLELVTDEQYVREGAGSLKYTRSGSSEAIGFAAASNVDWTQYTGMEFWVYNPSEQYDYAFDVCCFTEYAGAYSPTNGAKNIRVECPKGEWTKVTILADVLSDMTKATEKAPNGAPYFAFQILSAYNGGYVTINDKSVPSDQWAAIELYFDEFTFKTDTVISVEEYQRKYRVGDQVTIPDFNVLMAGGQTEYSVKVLKDGADITPEGTDTFTIDTYGNYFFSVSAPNGDTTITQTFPIYVYAEKEFEAVAHEDEFKEIVKGFGGANVTFSEKNTKDGNGSLRYRQAGTTTVFKFLNSPAIDWTKEEGLSFWVYNPSADYNYMFSIGGYVDLVQNWATNGNNAGSTFTVFKNGWTKVVIPGEQLVRMTETTETAPNGAPYIGIFLTHENNGKSTSTQWQSIDLYFDAFELTCKVEDSLLGSSGSTKIVETGFAELKVGTETKTAAWLQTRELYNYPNAVWSASNQLNWKDNKLTMKIYNPAEYDFLFQLRGFPVGVPYTNVSTMLSETVTLADVYIGAGETVEVTIFSESFDYTAYPYIGLYMDAYNNGGQNSTHFLACKLHFYDLTMSKGSLTNESMDYKLAQMKSLNSSAGYLNYNKAYIKDGEYSLWWKPTGTWVSSALPYSNEVDWSKVKTLKMYVYSPIRYPVSTLGTEIGYSFWLGQADNIDSAKYVGETYTVKKGWNEFTIDVSAWTTGQYMVLSTAQGTNCGNNPFYNGNTATEASTAAWKNLMDNGLYVDFAIEYNA